MTQNLVIKMFCACYNGTIPPGGAAAVPRPAAGGLRAGAAL